MQVELDVEPNQHRVFGYPQDYKQDANSEKNFLAWPIHPPYIGNKREQIL